MSTAPDKIVPHNLEAEEALLGSILIDPDVIIDVGTMLKPEDFYVQRHRWIYEATLHLHDQRHPVDFLTVVDELERKKRLHDVGGDAYITSLINVVPSAVHAFQYAEIVQRTATLRNLIKAAGEIARRAYDDSQDVRDVVDGAEALIFAISERHLARDLTPIDQIMREVMDELDNLQKRRGEIMGVPTGFTDLDKLLGGLQRSDLIIVAARPGMGKTSLALTMALNAAKFHKRNAAIFSLEMSNEQLVQRLLSQEARVNSQNLRLGKLHEGDWDRLAIAAGSLSECSIYIDDSAALTPFELRTKARRLYAKQPIDILIVDYMQLMTGGGDRKIASRRSASYPALSSSWPESLRYRWSLSPSSAGR